MPARLSLEQKRIFARSQFNELIKMGLKERVASKPMRTVGPALAVKTLQWTFGAWEAMETWMIESRRRMVLSNRPQVQEHALKDVSHEEVRDQMIAHLFWEDTEQPGNMESIHQMFRNCVQSYGDCALDHGFVLPPEDKLHRMIMGVKIILPHLPLC